MNAIAQAIDHIDATTPSTGDPKQDLAIEFLIESLREPNVLRTLQTTFNEQYGD